MRRVNTKVANIAVRLIGGVTRSVCKESLHLAVGEMIFSNLYVTHCAAVSGSCMRAHGSVVKEGLGKEFQ